MPRHLGEAEGLVAAETPADPPRELVVDPARAPGDSSDGSGTAMAPIVVAVLGAGAAAKFVAPLAGLAVVAVAIVFFVGTRKPNEGRFVLRVEEDVLVVTREKRKEPLARVPLDAIATVTLDREARPASRGVAASERVRIVLERDGEPIALGEERITPIEGQEWQGRVRVFLRKHGWLPKDERDVA